MTSSSGNSSGSPPIPNSGSEEDLQVVMDQRKRKRMQSNRESARRSRMRKQKHLDELMQDVNRLRRDNNQILTSINITTQHLVTVEAENSVLRAQFNELSQRLDSLNEILAFINNNNNNHPCFDDSCSPSSVSHVDDFINHNPMNMFYHNQPIMAASADIFHY